MYCGMSSIGYLAFSKVYVHVKFYIITEIQTRVPLTISSEQKGNSFSEQGKTSWTKLLYNKNLSFRWLTQAGKIILMASLFTGCLALKWNPMLSRMLQTKFKVWSKVPFESSKKWRKWKVNYFQTIQLEHMQLKPDVVKANTGVFPFFTFSASLVFEFHGSCT